MHTTSLVLAATIALIGCGADQSSLDRRVSEWKSTADAELPVGRSIDEVRAWGAKNKVVFTYLEKQMQLHTIVERVPESGGSRFVCSEWAIILKVRLTPGGTTAGNEVSKVGACL
jgi:hypothetical protein